MVQSYPIRQVVQPLGSIADRVAALFLLPQKPIRFFLKMTSNYPIEMINSDPPRIVVMLYSMGFLPYEGWYRRVYNEARALIETGYMVTLLAWDRECVHNEQETIDGIRIRRFRIPAGINQGPRNCWNHLRYNLALISYLIRHEFDIVHCFNLDTMPVGLLAAKLRCKKAVLDLCEPDYYKGFWPSRYNWLLQGVNFLEKSISKFFDHLFVHNTYQVKKFELYGVSRLTQVGSYPNRSLVTSKNDRTVSNVVTVGRVGTIYANNGYEELIDAFKILLTRQAYLRSGTQYKLRLAGNVFSNYESTFKSLIAPLGESVEVTGAYDVADLSHLYRQIDISILLYGKSTFSNVTPTKLFESMACGVPVVANATGDVAQILSESNCGVVVDPNNPESICDGIEKLASDAVLRRFMSANALKKSKEKFTWEAIKVYFLSAYSKL